MVVTGVVTDDMNPHGFWILWFNLLEPLDDRLGINGVVIADSGAEVGAIDDTIDVGPLPSASVRSKAISPPLR